MLPEFSLSYILPLVRRVLEFQEAHVIRGCLFDPGHPCRDSNTYNLINLLLYSVLHLINSVHFTFSPWVPTPCAPSGPLKPGNPGSPWQWRIIWNNCQNLVLASGNMWFLPSVLALHPLLGVQAGHPDLLLLDLPVTVTFSAIRKIGLTDNPLSGLLKWVQCLTFGPGSPIPLSPGAPCSPGKPWSPFEWH